MASPEIAPPLFLLKDLYETGKKKLKLTKDIFEANAKIGYLHEFLENVQLIKTIWQPEKKVKISDFYQATRIKSNQKTTLIQCLSDLPTHSNLIVKGIAGQGKSIFLRHLCSQELIKGEYIPLFAALRKIDNNYSITKLLFDTFSEMGLEFEEGEKGELFKHFADSGRLVLLLDGFDEIPLDSQKDTIRTLEHFAKKFPNLQIVISSRPNSDILNSDCFDVIDISPINREDRNTLLEKLCKDPSQTKLLRKTLAEKVDVAKIITTPLLVTLLVITYKTNQEIPEKLSSFYDNVFSTLLSRHDKSKPGFVRTRKSQLNDLEILECFNIISLLSAKSNISKFPEEVFVDLSQKALTENQKPPNLAKDLMEDIVQITNLIVQDGDEFHFIHKTIQEYHAAKFISKIPEKIAVAFYENLDCDDFGSNLWSGVLVFLEEIDKFKFVKYYDLPALCKAFNVSQESFSKERPLIDKVSFAEWFPNMEIAYIKKRNEEWFAQACMGGTCKNVWANHKFIRSNLIMDSLNSFGANVKVDDDFFTKFGLDIDNITFEYSAEERVSMEGGDRFTVNVAQVLTDLVLWDNFLEHLNRTTQLNKTYKNIINLTEFIKNEEKRKSKLLDLDF
jgi:hypothetical protein